MEDQNKVTKTPKRKQKETIKQKQNQRKIKTHQTKETKPPNQRKKHKFKETKQ